MKTARDERVKERREEQKKRKKSAQYGTYTFVGITGKKEGEESIN